MVVALVGAGLFWFSADERHDDAVRDLARAVVGCETTLDFARTGTFFIYLETAGTTEAVPGDCAAETGPFELPRGDRPEVRLTLIDPGGEELAITQSDGIAYDVDPYRGVQIGEVTVEATGDHRLAATSTDDAVVVAIGGDPDDGTDALRGAAIAVLVVGLLVAGALFVLAARRPPSTPGPTQGPGPGQGWGVAPPSAPTGPPLVPPGRARPSASPTPPPAPPGGAEPRRPPWAPPAPSGDDRPARPS